MTIPDPSHGITLALSLEGILVFLAILVLSAISNWVKRRGQPQEPGEPLPEEAPPPPSRTAPQQPRRLGDWEEELRRLLGEEPSAPPQAPPPPQPVVLAPPPIQRPLPRIPVPARPVPAPSRRFEDDQESTWSPEGEVVAGPPPLREADRAYQDASSLHEKVTKRMQHVARELGHHSRTTHAHDRANILHRAVTGHNKHEMGSDLYAPEFVARTRLTKTRASAYARLFRSQESIRSAIVGALILAPPKSLED